jgi:N-acetylglucosaminyl-diphospho-decaprenol L-rhamnosyltransferase
VPSDARGSRSVDEHMPDRRVGVAIATRNRRFSLVRTLRALQALPESPKIAVVDNASTDGTPDDVERHFADVELIRLNENLGAAARTVGVHALATDYVAFADDDSWWAPGSLALAADRFDASPELAVVAARILVGPESRLDPTSCLMAASPLPPSPRIPGVPVLGFLACAAVVRRSAYLEVGGFDRRFGIGSEETLLALDLASRGYHLVYADEVVAHHDPDPGANRDGRNVLRVRNALWTVWLRCPPIDAVRRTASVAIRAAHDPSTREGMIAAVRGLRWVLPDRRPLPRSVAEAFRSLDR